MMFGPLIQLAVDKNAVENGFAKLFRNVLKL
jgi:hypothetical protein